jgi:cell division transport system permease protein
MRGSFSATLNRREGRGNVVVAKNFMNDAPVTKLVHFEEKDSLPPVKTLEQIWSGSQTFERLGPGRRARSHVSSALRAMWNAPFTSLLTVLVSTTVLFALGACALLVRGVKKGVFDDQRAIELSIYLKQSLSSKEVSLLLEEVKSRKEVKEVRYQTSAESLQELKGSFSETEWGALEGLEGENPLPSSLEVSLHRTDELATVIQSLSEAYARHPLVEYTHYNRGILGQIAGFVRLFETSLLFLSCLAFLLAAFIIASTVRLSLYSHREEIEIMKLVGATQRFIKAPYVIEGLLLGILSVVASLFLLSVGVSVGVAVARPDPILSSLIPSDEYLSLPYSWVVVGFLFAASIGYSASSWAVRRFLQSK